MDSKNDASDVISNLHLNWLNPQIKDNDFENECHNQDLLINTDRSSLENNRRKLSVKFEMMSDEGSANK